MFIEILPKPREQFMNKVKNSNRAIKCNESPKRNHRAEEYNNCAEKFNMGIQ